MVDSVRLENCGPLRKLVWEDIGRLNLILGVNDTGKSILAKLIYAVLKAEERYIRIPRNRPNWTEHLRLKLHEVLTPTESSLGNLVHFHRRSLKASIETGGTLFNFEINRKSGKVVTDDSNVDIQSTKETNSIVFIPTKEVLTLIEVIKHTREIWSYPAFDDTYHDLVNMLSQPSTRVHILDDPTSSYNGLNLLINGEFFFGSPGEEITFNRGQQAMGMALTAEGVKKMGVITRLIQNGIITEGSVLFIDEPEVNLHPKALRLLVKLLFELASRNVQIFLTTHDYFVIKQCEIQARKWEHSSRVCVLKRKGDQVQAEIADLRDGIPENEIVNESIAMLNEDLSSRLQ